MTPADRRLLARARRDALAAQHNFRLGRADGARSDCFIAHWPGVCPRCRKPFKRGAVIRFHADYDDALVHDGCNPAPPPRRRKDSPVVTGVKKPACCPHCWTVHRGECL